MALKGKLINIRQIKKSDAQSIQKYANDKKVSKFVPPIPSPYSIEEAYRWVKYTQKKLREKSEYHFGIAGIDNDEIIGMVGLRAVNKQDKNAEIGCWLGKRFWNKGYTSEAINLMLGFAFSNLRLHRVYAIVQEANMASYRVLEKNNLVREGTWREASRMQNKYYDVYGYGILKSEYLKI